MIQELFLDSEYADVPLSDGSLLFYLPDPLHIAPGSTVRLLHSWIPNTFWAITPGNNAWEVNGASVELPLGNHSVDDVMEHVNPQLPGGWYLVYSAATNRCSLVNDDEAAGEVRCSATRLLGFEDQTGPSPLRARRGVNLTRTSGIYIRSNLATANRDPRTKRSGSDVLCGIPVGHQAPNEIIDFSSPGELQLRMNSLVSYVHLGLYDDDFGVLDTGTRYNITLQFRISDEPLRALPREAQGERQDGPEGRPVDAREPGARSTGESGEQGRPGRRAAPGA